MPTAYWQEVRRLHWEPASSRRLDVHVTERLAVAPARSDDRLAVVVARG